MMMDKNGREIKTGDVVRISGAYFKVDNALYFVDNSPGDPSWCGSDYSLYRVCKNGKISKGKDRVRFWPLKSYVSDREKNALAHDWNKEHAEIEVLDGIDRTEIKDHFSDEAENAIRYLNTIHNVWGWGKHSEGYVRQVKIASHYRKVADSI